MISPLSNLTLHDFIYVCLFTSVSFSLPRADMTSTDDNKLQSPLRMCSVALRTSYVIFFNRSNQQLKPYVSSPFSPCTLASVEGVEVYASCSRKVADTHPTVRCTKRVNCSASREASATSCSLDSARQRRFNCTRGVPSL